MQIFFLVEIIIVAHAEPALGLPAQLPRRASAYDVYSTPGGGSLNAMAIAAAQQRVSISSQGIHFVLFFIFFQNNLFLQSTRVPYNNN